MHELQDILPAFGIERGGDRHGNRDHFVEKVAAGTTNGRFFEHRHDDDMNIQKTGPNCIQ
jgi:hypothetical protein